jgi:hypothetical protein
MDMQGNRNEASKKAADGESLAANTELALEVKALLMPTSRSQPPTITQSTAL